MIVICKAQTIALKATKLGVAQRDRELIKNSAYCKSIMIPNRAVGVHTTKRLVFLLAFNMLIYFCTFQLNPS